jgi:RNA-binding protein
MTTFTLTGAERRILRGNGQLLEPAVHVGKEGVTPAITGNLDDRLTRANLVKVRANTLDRQVRGEQFEALAASTHSLLLGTVGRTALYYRPDASTLTAEAGETGAVADVAESTDD